MYFSNLAGVNVGVITTIWSLNPIFLAIADYFINKQKLKYYHSIGLISIICCCVAINLSDVFKSSAPNKVSQSNQSQVWVPVIFGILTAMAFTSNGMLTKHLTSPRINFNASTISYSAYLAINVIVIIAAIPYWLYFGFSQYLFWMGLLGSFFSTLAIVSFQNAISIGPAGPVAAIVALSQVLLFVVEAFRNSKVPSSFEIIGLALGFFGAIIIVIP